MSPSQPRSTGTPPSRQAPPTETNEATRVYGFDLNEQWQQNKDHYDNQKFNGLTLPRSIRQSAFSQKLDIEGCDPLTLPVAALLYQQANNHWLRKLAHGRELFLIPTGDIAALVFATELLSQLRNRGIDLDKASQCRARKDGKLLDKTANTKYAAQMVAEHIQAWLPIRAADPESQHEITALRTQLADLRQRLGEDNHEPSTPPPNPPSGANCQSTPIQRALHGASSTTSPTFSPSCLLTVPATSNTWLEENMPNTLAVRSFQKWLKELPITEHQQSVLNTNISKTETWWAKQPAESLEQVQKVAVMMGVPITMLDKNFDALNLMKLLTAAISMTN